ncbi:branched-chain amino acid ABC transporter permease [Sedimentibacter sp. MB31-C6]|uniref:branched-chain amino acid ABC transporter permease n=1 Tax=Sedimentibacter sp. MB31-C6 TaxID=3109366 RepID=UPI002DDCD5D2|nr:branched-chain amino acid ABC transporter permease [Sedimentibacter sp. MB36-C1]WSI05312.1 branched-chain amino acid ABC transporter permease [Sedimentibacter sp. MB36-C1]
MSWVYISGILILAGINLLTVLGLSLLTGFTGMFSFGHAGFMAIGAYTAAIMTMKLGMNFYLALMVGGLAAMTVSLLIGKLTLNLKGDYFCIATLGFGEAIRLILDNVQFFGGARGLPNIPTDNTTTLINVVVINIIAIIVMVFIIKSRHGRNMVAVREEELAAQVIGINTFKYKIISLAISALYAGIAGGLMAHYLGYIQPLMFKLIKSTELTIIVIFGGLGSISGSVIGAIILTFLPELLRSVYEWRLVVYGAAVILIMATRPQGLMGGKEFSFKWIIRLIKGIKKHKEEVKS